MQIGDSVGIGGVMAPRFVVSTGRFAAGESFVAIHALADLAQYARRRAVMHERLRLQAVTFNSWRGRNLEFGPIRFQRSADDLGSGLGQGIGKGEYVCGEGFTALNFAPDPFPGR